MSFYNGVVTYDWGKLENQPIYVTGLRRESEKHGFRIELAVDRSGDEEFRGTRFTVYGPNIQNLALNDDVDLRVDVKQSTFINQKYGAPQPFIVAKSLTRAMKVAVGLNAGK